MGKDGKSTNFFANQPADGALQKFMDELDELDLDDLDEDDVHGTDLDEEKWAVYKKFADTFCDLADKDKSILKVLYLEKPNPADDFARVQVTFPIISVPEAETRKAIADAINACDMFFMSAAGEKVRMSFSFNDIWKSHD